MVRYFERSFLAYRLDEARDRLFEFVRDRHFFGAAAPRANEVVVVIACDSLGELILRDAVAVSELREKAGFLE